MNGGRCGLLVSVRSAEEAADAVDAGADLIDVKEPRAGSLGAASSETIAAVMAAVAGRRPVSVALGELVEREPALAGGGVVAMGSSGRGGLPTRSEFSRDLDPVIRFAKIGLAGCARIPDWEAAWRRQLTQLCATTAAVAVIYADWEVATSPPPQMVIEAAARNRCRAVLVDTFDKRGPSLTRLWSRDTLHREADRVHDAGLMLVLAGKLIAEDFAQLLPLEPDYLAVRGAACAGDREGRLSGDRVRALRDILHTTSRG